MIEKLKEQIAGGNLCQQMGIDAAGQAERRAFVGLTGADADLLRELAPLIEAHAGVIVDGFYANVESQPVLKALIGGAGSSVERLKRTQHDYLLELFKGDYGAGYFERRLRIGLVHHKVGLTPRWYLGSYSVYLRLIARVIFKRWWWNPARALRATLAVDKVLSLDAQLAIDTYIHGLTADLTVLSLSKGELERRVADYRTLIARVAQGDLTPRVSGEGDDDLSRLGENLNQMVGGLAEMTGRVTETSSAILVSVEQMRGAISAQSAGASQQAASVNETSTTLEQIKATSQQNLEKAMALKEVADRARAEGDEGLAAVETAVTAMRDTRGRMEGIAGHIMELNERLQQIGEITSSVGELAQQSKMLALNASIEAAKAGDAGRGFAVVAEEVKDMADQSRQATTQVQRILEDIRIAAARTMRAMEEGNEGAGRGADLADRAGSVLRNLNRVIHDTTLGAQQIVGAVRQEAAGIEQIRIAMHDINQVTAQYVAATHQTESATDHLTEYASQLQSMVRRFKVESAHFDFEMARAIHRTWVARLESFLAGRDGLGEHEAVSHHHCELGLWYDGEGLLRYGHIPEIHALQTPHREMHELIREAVGKRHAGKSFDAAHIVGRVHALSGNIIGLLNVIERKVGGAPADKPIEARP